MDDEDPTGRDPRHDPETHDDGEDPAQPAQTTRGEELSEALVAFLSRISRRAIRLHPHDRS